MKRICLALAVGLVALVAAPVSADNPTAPAPTPVVTTPAPVVVGGPATTGDVIAPAPARRGLFSRLRNRGMRSNVVMPAAPGTVITPAPVYTPAPPTAAPAVPAPLPSRPITGGSAVVVPSSGVVMNGTMVTTAGYTVIPEQTQVRRGLFGRFRTRGTGTVVPASMPMPMPTSGIVPASAAVTSATPTVVMPTGMPVMAEPTTTATPRRGLLARLRARRG